MTYELPIFIVMGKPPGSNAPFSVIGCFAEETAAISAIHAYCLKHPEASKDDFFIDSKNLCYQIHKSTLEKVVSRLIFGE